MPEKPGPWTGNVSLVGDQRLCYTLMIELKLATASSLGPTTKGKEILNAECDMPMMVPFRVYDENHKLALLTDVQRESDTPQLTIADAVNCLVMWPVTEESD
ncbi:unnamed protein product [Calypogeia fissa]